MVQQRPISFSKAQRRITAVSSLLIHLILFILSVFIASCIQYKIPDLCQRKKLYDSRKGAENRKHFNVKKNQLSKLYLLLDDTAEHHKTTGMGHKVLLKNHSRWDRRERENGKKKQKGMTMQTGQVCEECTRSFNNILREKRKTIFSSIRFTSLETRCFCHHSYKKPLLHKI